MKPDSRLSIAIILAFFLVASCEGPRGLKGDTGDDGIDANVNCTQCHNNDAIISLKSAQWENSVHATGGNAAYANRSGCVQCHTSQGFLEYIAEGSAASITVPAEPMQINCYTCHKIHTTFTSADWAFTKPQAQTLDVKYAGADVVWDKGTSNQCVACHQERPVSPAPVANGADFTITSNRIGPHHAPNSNIILGKTPFEVGAGYPTTNTHSTTKGCVTCHMATPYGYLAGGHNMAMEYDSHGTITRLVSGCTPCHDISSTSALTAFNTKISNFQTSIQAKLDSLETKLVAAGVYDASTDLPKTGTFKANAVLAWLNFNTVVEDKSLGVHNPAYIRKLLRTSIDAMKTLGY
jgi:hypothetical protein